MKIKIGILLAIMSVGSLNKMYAQAESDNVANKIEEIITKAVELDRFSGCVLVAKKGEIIFSGAFGEADKDFRIKNTLDTKFNIASVTKTFTAVSIMILDQKGILNINDPVIKYLSDFPFGDKITINHLLTHTAGFGDYEEDPEYLGNMHNIKNLNGVLEIIYKRKLLFDKPGTEKIYSNSGAALLGAVIEKVSGLSYAEFLKQNIFLPLRMNNTVHSSPDEIVPNKAVGYVKKYSGKFRNTLYEVIPASPATGITTTVGDLLIYDQALYGSQLLDDEHKRIMFTPFFIDSADAEPYACLWEVRNRNNNTIAGHAGRQVGFNSRFYRYTDDKYTIIILSNYDYGAESIYSRIEAAVFESAYTLPGITADIYLYSLIKKNWYDSVEKNINGLLEENNYKITSPGSLNTVGYKLIEEGDIQMAIYFFSLNVNMFPDNANAYDSLGEAYMLAGNKDLALLNYKKSVELDSSNTGAIGQIKKLENMN